MGAPVSFILAAASASLLVLLTLHTSPARGATTAEPPQGPTSPNVTCCGGDMREKVDHQQRHWNHNRVSRSTPPATMEEKLKEFAEKLGKTPDDLRAAFGKFMLAQGISVQQMQEELERGHQAALQIVDSIKNAMRA